MTVPEPARPGPGPGPDPDPEPVLPHPRTGAALPSPAPPGSGWPGDPADAGTPVAHDAGDVVRLASSVGALRVLDAVVSVCRACPRLVDWREDVARVKRRAWRREPYWGRPAPGFGDPRAHLLVVGLAPAAHGANRTGRVFTGDRSGDWLFAALHRAGVASQPTSTDSADGLELRGVRVASAVRCAPPGNVPLSVEKDTCRPWLRREIELLDDHLVAMLALGLVGWQAALRVARDLGWSVARPAPRFGHGASTELVRPDGRSVLLVGSYHVSQQNTQTGRLTEEMLDAAVARALFAAPDPSPTRPRA